MISLDDVRAAARRIDGVAHRTPLLKSRALDEAVGASVLLKAENLQRIGAFKFRGAYNAVASLSDEERARGVATVSSGNHAQAVALAARLTGARAAKALLDDVRVVGVEPEAGDDTRRSLAAGERVRIPVPRTIADGQQLPAPGELTFPVIRERVDAVELASDAEIVNAMRFLFERLKSVAEPSGACALAALLAGRVGDVRGLRVGVTISGGNVTAARFAELVAPQRSHE